MCEAPSSGVMDVDKSDPVVAYRLVEQRGNRLYPLYFGRDYPFTVGVWYKAENFTARGPGGFHACPNFQVIHAMRTYAKELERDDNRTIVKVELAGTISVDNDKTYRASYMRIVELNPVVPITRHKRETLYKWFWKLFGRKTVVLEMYDGSTCLSRVFHKNVAYHYPSFKIGKVILLPNGDIDGGSAVSYIHRWRYTE